MISGADVEHAMLDVLRDWLPSYLAEYEGQHGLVRGTTPAPRGWVRTGRNLQKLNSDQLPCIALMAGGILTAPRKQGSPGGWIAVWTVDVGCVLATAWGGGARDHVQAYAAAIRDTLCQRPVGGELSVSGRPWPWTAVVDWRGEAYDADDFSTTRTYADCLVPFYVEVQNVGWATGGPPPRVDPPADPTAPLDPWVEVVETDVTVEKLPLT
jgi:hypothetical protein